MKALELIGKLYEVGAFVELKETTVINKKAVDIKAQLIERIKEVIDVDAKPDRSGAKSLQEEIEHGEFEHADTTAGPPPVVQADTGSPNAYYSTQTNIHENEN